MGHYYCTHATRVAALVAACVLRLLLMAKSNMRQAQFRSAIGEIGQEEEKEEERQEVVVHLLTTESPSREPERRQ